MPIIILNHPIKLPQLVMVRGEAERQKGNNAIAQRIKNKNQVPSTEFHEPYQCVVHNYSEYYD